MSQSIEVLKKVLTRFNEKGEFVWSTAQLRKMGVGYYAVLRGYLKKNGYLEDVPGNMRNDQLKEVEDIDTVIEELKVFSYKRSQNIDQLNKLTINS